MKPNFKPLNKKSSSLILFLLGGFSAGFLTLIFSTIINSILKDFSFWSKESLVFLIILVLVEEFIKFSLINFLLINSKIINLINIFKGIFFGLGFGFFEFILIFPKFNPQLFELFPILLIMLVHTITSALLIITIIYLKNNSKIFITYFLLAILLHLIYNFNIITYQHLQF